MIQLVLALQFLAHSFAQTDICTLPAETGPCRTSEIRYFYNAQSRKCEEFLYGGCLGNANNFETKKECETYCGKEKTCNPWTENFSNCASMCPSTCDSVYDPAVPCPLPCIPGCVCKPGFIRSGRRLLSGTSSTNNYHSSSEFGPCIPVKFCKYSHGPSLPPPRPSLPPPPKPPGLPPEPPLPPHYCNPYTEEYSNCGTMCPETCWNSGTNVPCATICVPGCICKPGFVRAGRSCGGKPYDQSCNQQRTNDLMPVGTSAAFLFGPCIPRAWCNATYPPRPPIMRCPYNEHYEECGTACPETCLTLGSNVPCPLICKSGCFCNDGYVRAGQSVGMPVPQIPLIFPSSDFGNHGQGPCVPIFQCSLYTPGPCTNLPDGFYVYDLAKPCTNQYFTCLSGKYAKHQCMSGMSFDLQSNICKPTSCVPACVSSYSLNGCGISKK